MGKRVYVYGQSEATIPKSDFVLKADVEADGAHVQSIVSQSLVFGDFTDNADATGYVDITTILPGLAIPLGWKAVISAGFAGNTTAVMQVGIAGDLNKFSGATTASCLYAAVVAAPANNDALLSATAETIRVTVTGGTDFTAITAGSMVVTLYYVQMPAAI